MLIAEVKARFNTKEAYNVYSACMYMPTWEEFYEKAEEYINNDSIDIFGFLANDKIIGLCAIKRHDNAAAEVLGIAVSPLYRKQGIGKRLIRYIISNDSIKTLFAETDGDAVEFYARCGFEIDNIYKEYDGVICKRYKCALRS